MEKILAKIKAGLRRRKLGALLISQPENRRYLSGYTATDAGIAESSGYLLIPAQGTSYLLTDSRFTLQAERDTTGFEVAIYDKGLAVLLKKLLGRVSVTRLAFESHYMLHSTFLSLTKMLAQDGIEIIPTSGLIEKLRLYKTEEELTKISASVLLNEEVFQTVYPQIKAGMTELNVAMLIENTMRQKGASAPSFETIVAGGPNGALPHAVPGDRPIKNGEPIVIDMGLILDGYCSDMTRTVVLGEVDAKTKKIFRLVRKAQVAGMQAIRAGIAANKVDNAARRVISEAGYGANFGHGLGHGVGLAVHEAPSISRRNRKQLRAGMVVTVEPGIYLPGWGGVRLENMLAVEETGGRNLNRDTTFLDI